MAEEFKDNRQPNQDEEEIEPGSRPVSEDPDVEDPRLFCALKDPDTAPLEERHRAHRAVNEENSRSDKPVEG